MQIVNTIKDAVKDDNGVVLVSPELWEELARIIENSEEVKHGEWEVCSDEYEICASEFVCSNCKESFCASELTDSEFLQMMKYCPNCGAKMDIA